MLIYQVPIAASDLLKTNTAVLYTIDWQKLRIPVAQSGWNGRPGQLPTQDRPNAFDQQCRQLSRLWQQKISSEIEIRAFTYYPAGGGMGWHTNSTALGWRIYIPRVCVESNEFTGLVLPHDKQIPDREGHANLFEIAEWGKSWHAVVASVPRLSIGMRVSSSIAESLLKLSSTKLSQ